MQQALRRQDSNRWSSKSEILSQSSAINDLGCLTVCCPIFRFIMCHAFGAGDRPRLRMLWLDSLLLKCPLGGSLCASKKTCLCLPLSEEETMALILKCGLIRPHKTFPPVVIPCQTSLFPEKWVVVYDLCSLHSAWLSLVFVAAAKRCVYGRLFLLQCRLLLAELWLFGQVMRPTS